MSLPERTGAARLVAIAIASSTASALADSLPYDVSVDLGTYTPIVGGTVHQPVGYALGYEASDEGAVEVSLPFPVEWLGTEHSSVFVFTNGFVSFSPPPPPPVGILGPPAEVPSFTNRPHDVLGVLWANLQADPTTGRVPELRVRTFGNAPAREVVIQAQDFRRTNVPGSRANFQVRFHEDGTIRAVIGPNALLTGGATVIENATGTLGANLLETGGACGVACRCAPRTCASANWREGLTITLSRPTLPELIGTIDGPNGAYPGDAFTATVTLSNVGRAACAATTGELRMSEDDVIDASDLLLGSWSAPALAAGESASHSLSITMPSVPVARYFLGLVSDASDAVTEAFEDNDTAIDPGGLASGPDLSARVYSPLGSGPGEDLDIRVDVTNQGAPLRTTVGVEIYLSTDDVLGAGDRFLDRADVALPDGFSATHTFHTSVPADATPSPPSYRIIVAVDQLARVGEYDESNNISRAPNVLTLAAADIELVATRMPRVAFLGMGHPIDLELTNRGGAVARDFELCTYVSDDLALGPPDVELDRRGPVSLRSGESIHLRLEPEIDLPEGSYFVGVVADCTNVVSEALETNNRIPATQVDVREPAPDFVAEEASSPSTAAAGELTPVSALVANLGVLAGTTRVRFFFSRDRTLEATDTLLGDTSSFDIPPFEDHLFADWVSVPRAVTSGLYYLIAAADPDNDVYEVSEGDEVVVAADPVSVLGADLEIVSPAPPNAVVGVPYTSRFSAQGGSGSYTWELDWIDGGAPAGIGFDALRAELAGVAEPGTEGPHPFRVRVRSAGETTEVEGSLLIVPPTLPLAIVSGKLPPARQREVYLAGVVAVGGVLPYSFSGGAGLPDGLELTLEGEVRGTPGAAGAYLFEVTVEDALGATMTARLAIDVIDPAATVSITTSDVPAGVVGEPYDVTFSSQGGTPPLLWTLEGSRVPGLEFTEASARLVGTPTVAGRYPFVLEVRDSRGLLDRNAYVLEVYEVGELEIDEDTPLPRAKLGEPYVDKNGNPVIVTVSLRGGGEPVGVRFQVALGELPPGLELDQDTGIISGAARVEGAFPFTLLAVDSGGDFDRATFAIVVAKESLDTIPDSNCTCRSSSAGESQGALGLFALFLLRRRRGPR
ncbi:MAG: hypothetical protein HYV07_26705 [Deltaproteobacteria bacterium]|nr:hypothetical protein [Deltaproteobacteria bacterium]